MKKLTALGCGLLLTLGLTTPTLANQYTIKTEKVASQDNRDRLIRKVGYLYYATESLKEGSNHATVWYLERILEQDNSVISEGNQKIKRGATLEYVKELTEKVIDKNLKDEHLMPYLLKLAKGLYYEEKIAMASDNFQEILENATENLELLGAKSGFNYHAWFVYISSLKDAREETTHAKVLEKTHKKVRDYYRASDLSMYIFIHSALKSVEDGLPKGDSDLIKKVKKVMIESKLH